MAALGEPLPHQLGVRALELIVWSFVGDDGVETTFEGLNAYFTFSFHVISCGNAGVIADFVGRSYLWVVVADADEFRIFCAQPLGASPGTQFVQAVSHRS